MTHGLNSIADGLRLPLDFSPSARVPIASLNVDFILPAGDVEAVLDEIASFYTMDSPPAVFRYMARDPIFLKGYWGATREAFSDRTLGRRTKEILALAASLTAKSDYGVDLHLREVRRLGVSEQALTEAIEVVQCFNTVTKIADALQLQPDFDRAPGRG